MRVCSEVAAAAGRQKQQNRVDRQGAFILHIHTRVAQIRVYRIYYIYEKYFIIENM